MWNLSLLNIAPSKSALPFAAVLARIAVFGLGLALLAGAVHQPPVYWVDLLAPGFFLAAVWVASNAFVRMDRGDAFGPAMVRGLKQIGSCLMLGALGEAVVQPFLTSLIINGLHLMRGARVNFDIETLTLALVGLLLILLARKGEALQSTLEEFV